MPRPARSVAILHEIPDALYSPFADRLRDHPGPIFPLHIGDTWMEPFVARDARAQVCSRLIAARRACGHHAAITFGLNESLESRGVTSLDRGFDSRVRSPQDLCAGGEKLSNSTADRY